MWLFDGLILSGRSDLLGLTVLWDGFVTLHIALDEKMKTELCGVCGNNDNNVENEHLQVTLYFSQFSKSISIWHALFVSVKIVNIFKFGTHF